MFDSHHRFFPINSKSPRLSCRLSSSLSLPPSLLPEHNTISLSPQLRREIESKQTHRLGIKVGLAALLSVAAFGDDFKAVHRSHQPGRERHASREGKERRPLRPGPAHERGEARVEGERRRRRRRSSRGRSIAARGVVSTKRREQAFQTRPQGAPLGLVGCQQRGGRLGKD